MVNPVLFWTGIGIGTGILVHVFYSIIGLGLVIATNPTIFTIFKLLGVGYLLYLAYLGLQSGKISLHNTKGKEQFDANPNPGLSQVSTDGESALVRQTLSAVQSYRIGFLTNALNVKATIFFLSIYLLVADNSPLSLQIAYGFYMAMATGLYFVLLAEFVAKLRPFLRQYLPWLEIGTALLLAILAILLALFSTQDLI